MENTKTYYIPFAYEMYGRIPVEVESENPTIEEIQKVASEKLKKWDYRKCMSLVYQVYQMHEGQPMPLRMLVREDQMKLIERKQEQKLELEERE